MYRLSFIVAVLFLAISTSRAQVNLPTGRAEFNFPLYSYSDGNRLSTSVSLNYTGGGGIKVDEMASSVGLGWELQYGGIISRTAIGEPDDQIGRDLDGFDAIGTGFYKHTYPTLCETRAGWVPMFSAPARFFKHDAQTIADKEEDIFAFRFGKDHGSFVIGKDGTILPLEQTNLKIEKFEEDMSASQIVTRISKFVITTEDGIQYVFNDKTLNRIISYETAPPVQFALEVPVANRSYHLMKTNFKVNNYYSVDNWLLSEIINPLTGKKITFNYESYSLDYITGEDAIQSIEKVDDTNYKNVIQWIQRRFNGVVKRISAIQLPNNTSIEFTYFDNNRVDLAGDKALKQVAIKENSQERSGYVFSYQYFAKNVTRPFNYAFPADEAPYARLSLMSVQRKGTGGYLDKPYSFSYYIGHISGNTGWVPARMTPSRDHWGYYNAIAVYPYDNSLNIYKNMANLFAARGRAVHPMCTAQNGCLKTVTYPTGGTLNFEYEQNTAWANNTVKSVGGVRVKKITQSDAIDNAKLITSEYKYVDEAGHPSGWGYEDPVYEDKTTTTLVVPDEGDYYAAVMVYNMAPNVLSYLLALDKDAAHIAKLMGEQYASSALQITLYTAVLTYMVGKIFSPSGELRVETKTNDVSNSSHPKNMNPLPFLYKRVEVYSGTQTENIGKTVHEFTSNDDFPITVQEFKKPYSSRQRYFSGAYGLPKRSKIFNKLNEPVKEVYNKYKFYFTENTDLIFHSLKCSPAVTLICPVDNYSSNSYRISFLTDDYYPLIGRTELEYSTEKTYSDNNYMMQRTDYTYDPVFFDLKKVSTVNSLGETVEKRMYYPYDYNIDGPLAEMKDKNILDATIATETWLLKPSGEELLVDAELSDYQQISNGDYMPVNVYRLNSTSPVGKAIIGEFDPEQLNRNGTYLKQESIYSYNDNGDVSQALAHGRLESSLFDDNGEETIAIVMNATTGNIAYSSFEERGLGSWQIPAAGLSMITTDATSPTGNRCMKLSATSTLTKTGLDAAKEYFVTYWYKGGAVTLSGATVTKDITGQTVNGWTFKMLRIRQPASLSVTGTAYIDELRLYPVDAKMVTKCYNELTKVSAMTAADNTTVYYEYDELGRLKITRDAQRNIVGLHEYKDRQ